jgi:hypothetical protein
MLTQTPGEDASSRPGGSDDKNRSIRAALHSAPMGYSPFWKQSSFEHFTSTLPFVRTFFGYNAVVGLAARER